MGINATRSAFLMAPEVFSPCLAGFPKGLQRESSWGNFAPHGLLREAVRMGGPPIKDSCHLFGLSSGKEYKEPFPCNQHSRTDQGIYLCKHKCEKLRAAKAV